MKKSKKADPLVEVALAFATAAHAGVDQRRKYTGEPYIVHPVAVAEIVASTGARPAMIAAALLHDVVEDTFVTLSEIEAIFGFEIASLVEQLTDVSKPEDGSRAERKAIDLAHSALASPDGQTIKLADLIHNSASITEHDPGFAVTFMREKRALLLKLTAGNRKLQDRAWEILLAWEAAGP